MALEEMDLNRLKRIIKTRSYRSGSITLASGKNSNYYFDMKPTMLDPMGSTLLGDALFSKVKPYDVDYVGGLEIGAIPLTTLVVAKSQLTDHSVNGFIVRKQPKDHGTQNRIEGLTLDESLNGKRIAVLEDVTTTGKSANTVVENLQNIGAKVVVVISILDRRDGAKELFESQGVAFESLFTDTDFVEKPIVDTSYNLFDQWWSFWGFK